VRYLVGIGTYYGRDDSIGLKVAEAIAERGLDHDFTAIDLGGNLLDLVHYLGEDTGAVLVVDAARMGRAAGEWAFFAPEDVATCKSSAGMSTHEGDLLKVLEFASALGGPLPPVTILGIEPAELGEGPGLSGVLAGRFDEYLDAAVGFFARG
jgi:hydrogenase maturation protease